MYTSKGFIHIFLAYNRYTSQNVWFANMINKSKCQDIYLQLKLCVLCKGVQTSYRPKKNKMNENKPIVCEKTHHNG